MDPKDLLGKDLGKNDKSNSKSESEPIKQKQKFTTFKYSSNGAGNLNESVIIQGKPYFVTYNHNTKKIEVQSYIDKSFGILIPPQYNEISYIPYEFESLKNIQEIADYIVESNTGLDTLYSKAKEILCKYNDQHDYKLTSVSADVIGSYFQDRFSTTHYDLFVGGVGGGKSALAETFCAIGYRPVNLTDPSAPNLFRLLGSVEVGQCTIIMEEAEKIDQFYEIMAVLKTGYTRNGRVPRINSLTMLQEFFYTFCFKIIVAERSPSQSTAKGVLDRCFILNCYKGTPKYDIKEVINPTNTGGIENKRHLQELKDFRNLLLVYRLMHFKDDIPDVDIGILGRDKELVKPSLQLFQKSKSKEQLIAAYQTILDLKNQRKGASLEAALLLTLRNVVGTQQRLGESTKTEVPFKKYWEKLAVDFEGKVDEKRPGEFHSTEFGRLYGTTVGAMLHDKFGVESKHRKNGNLLVIDYDTLEKLEKIHNSKIIVAVPSKSAVEGEHGEYGEHNPEAGSIDNSEILSESDNEKQDNKDPNELKGSSKEGYPLPISSSLSSPSSSKRKQMSQGSIKHEATKVGCYACQEFKLTDDKEDYKKHCSNAHPDGKITTRTIPMRDTKVEGMPLILLSCPGCEFEDVTPATIESHINTIHPEYIISE